MERGDATAEDVDIAMRLGAGHPMGPIHLSDYVGQDVNNFVLQVGQTSVIQPVHTHTHTRARTHTHTHTCALGTKVFI